MVAYFQTYISCQTNYFTWPQEVNPLKLILLEEGPTNFSKVTMKHDVVDPSLFNLKIQDV